MRNKASFMVSASLVATLVSTTALAQQAPRRNAYFGETHVHTGWSFDAYIFGNHYTTPADAYRYAKGEAIKHPMGYDIKIDTPLDWMGVTDHSEYAGVVPLANDPNSAIAKLPIAKELIVHQPSDIQRIYLFLGDTMINNKPIKALIAPEVAGSVWKQNNEMADKANEPGKFTAFCSYEWTSTPDNRNMHRNVFFRDCAKVPELPFSSLDSTDPTDLWKWMDDQRQAGNALLAISHNANLSDGHMFPIDVDEKGRPIDAAWAASRDRNELLTEIKQIKGQSETHPVLSPNDEFANYELLNYLLGDPKGRNATIPGSFVRQGLKDGLSMQAAKGYNPYKMGFVGGSDSHNTGVPYRQNNFFGGHGLNDGSIKERMAGHVFAGLDTRYENPAGLTGVWAEENTRASLFDAMQRKETFATSGPRIQLRFFGGWDYASDPALAQSREFWKAVPDWLKDREWTDVAYRDGVAMGSDLRAPPQGEKAPSFAVWAVKDPTSGNLDRIQIVKGWSKNGQSFEKVYDVAWTDERRPDPETGAIPPIGSTVDVPNATYTNTIGAAELKTVWTDPDFDPTLDAFYYARVLEIPTPRWTTIQAHELGISPPETVPATVQERAWSSPIWYTPNTDARSRAAQGQTVADLLQEGATEVSEAQLRDLVVGKSVFLQNNVTGGKFRTVWQENGLYQVKNVDPRILQPSDVGDISRGGYEGTSSPYQIKGSKIETTVGNAPFQITVYKLGEKYFGARSNEFGYANYEIIPTPQQLGTEVEFQLQ
jgi:hypothetical protein